MAGKFEIYQDKAGKFRWRLKASNGEIVVSGEAYATRAAAIKAPGLPSEPRVGPRS